MVDSTGRLAQVLGVMTARRRPQPARQGYGRIREESTCNFAVGRSPPQLEFELPFLMNEVTITFDQVFEIVRDSRRNRAPCTEFGFQSGVVKEHGIAVPGSPQIEAGMTVTAVLERPGDWRTLLGWVNHETGEIACSRTPSNVGGIGAMALGTLLAYHLVGTNPILAAIVVVVSIACCVGAVVGTRKAIRSRRLLERVQMTFVRRDAGSNG